MQFQKKNACPQITIPSFCKFFFLCCIISRNFASLCDVVIKEYMYSTKLANNCELKKKMSSIDL